MMFETYWPHVLAAVSVAMASWAAIHATMTKTEVRAALGWVGVILLSPFLGAVIYFTFGINRIHRKSPKRIAAHRATVAQNLAEEEAVGAAFGPRMAALARLGARVGGATLTAGNQIEILPDGDATYGAMIAAIAAAESSILLESYIFDHDEVGLRIVAALAEAQTRGVAVRVLIDAVGVRYSRPTILRALVDDGIPTALFNGRHIIGLRLPYANLRTHRKILVVDGRIALAGGMNIRAGFTREFAGNTSAHDTHFRITGPAVSDYLAIAQEDWTFATGEHLPAAQPRRAAPPDPGEAVLMRVVASGPDARLETAHKLLMGAFSTAERHIRIMSPYFLPDRELISALTTAARRGVAVDIVTPAESNLTLVDRAMQAQFDQVLKDGCRVWRASGPFDHSKLLTIDGVWSFVGSSNLDPRSLRLNFEIDAEIYDRDFAARIETRIDSARSNALPVTLEDLRARPFLHRLANRALWLGSPYL